MTLIGGAELCGFWGFFEASYGNPDTPKPYATVTPSKVGGALLPFPCPRCGECSQSLACPKLREHFHDTRRGQGHYFCPKCGERFYLDLQGIPLEVEVTPGMECAPARMTRGKVTRTIGIPVKANGLDVLGA